MIQELNDVIKHKRPWLFVFLPQDHKMTATSPNITLLTTVVKAGRKKGVLCHLFLREEHLSQKLLFPPSPRYFLTSH